MPSVPFECFELGVPERAELASASCARVLRQSKGSFQDALPGLMAQAAHARGILHLFPELELPRNTDEPSPLWWREAHALGWVHQHYFEPERQEQFARHHTRERKHDSIPRATQLYTPRWIADMLAQDTLALISDSSSSCMVCDPAMGAGQMLLAMLDAWRTRVPDADAMACAHMLHGVDLDPDVVAVARAHIKLRLAEIFGTRIKDAEEVVDAQLCVGDGLRAHARTFDVVLSNPPYMGARAMPKSLKVKLRQEFSPFHQDLCVAFMRRCFDLATSAVGLLVQQSVWYLSRFESARRVLLKQHKFVRFVHLGTHAFASLDGEKANVVCSIHRCAPSVSVEDTWTQFVDLRNVRDPTQKRSALLAMDTCKTHHVCVDEFDTIPGAPLAYWIPSHVRGLFQSDRCLGDIAIVPGAQNKTGANARFVRRWNEVKAQDVHPAQGLWEGNGDRWVFYSKGGKFAPWWGNWTHVVDWSKEARAFYQKHRTSNLVHEQFWFRQGLCYTDFGGQRFNARWMPAGCLFDMTGPAVFVDGDDECRLMALLAILNSGPARALLNALNPSIHYQVRDVRNLPLPMWTQAQEEHLACEARALVAGVRRLHQGYAGDVLFLNTAVDAEEDDTHRRQRMSALLDRWHELDAYVCALYAWTPPGSRPPKLHHMMK